jgi:hypothetical protein
MHQHRRGRRRVESVPQHMSEVAGLASLVGQAADGDVVAMMTQDREEVDIWLAEHGATRDGAEELRAKVLRARSSRDSGPNQLAYG